MDKCFLCDGDAKVVKKIGGFDVHCKSYCGRYVITQGAKNALDTIHGRKHDTLEALKSFRRRDAERTIRITLDAVGYDSER